MTQSGLLDNCVLIYWHLMNGKVKKSICSDGSGFQLVLMEFETLARPILIFWATFQANKLLQDIKHSYDNDN